MITIRTRIFAIVSLIILFVLGASILLVVLSKRRPAGEVPAGGAEEKTVAITQDNFASRAANLSGAPSVQPLPTGATVLPQSPAEAEKNAVRQLAKIFLERYSSYSTDSNYQNIRDVANLVTPEFWRTLEEKIPAAGGTVAAGQFVGVTTVVMSFRLTEFSGDSAVVALDAVQTTDRNGQLSSEQKRATVALVKDGGDWLVSGMDWEE